MIILDTNVISALMGQRPDPAVVKWMDRQAQESLWTTAINVFEVQFELRLLPEGRRRRNLEMAFGHVITDDLDNRVLPFDELAAEMAASLDALRRRNGNQIDVKYTQIAGIVLSRRAVLATRNVRHFSDIDAKVINPWEIAEERR